MAQKQLNLKVALKNGVITSVDDAESVTYRFITLITIRKSGSITLWQINFTEDAWLRAETDESAFSTDVEE